MASDEAFSEYLRRTGVRPADQLVVDEIRKAPRFFNPVSGAFDRQAYEQFVQQQLGMTDAQFEALLRDELGQSQFVSGVAAAMHAPRIYDALVAASLGEGRTFSYFVLPPTAVPPPVSPTDAQLTGFVKQHAEQLKRPETRVLTLLSFNAASGAPAPIDEKQVQKRFDFEKDALSTSEKRSLVQIPVKDARTAADVMARLRRGEDAALVAKAVGQSPIVYTDSPKSAIADRKIADAAFAMKPGEVSSPVQGDLGLAVLKLTQVTPGHQASLAEVRPKIEAEVRKEAAQAKVDQQVRKYEDLRSGGSGLGEAAKQLGITPVTLQPMTADGKTLQGQQAALPPKLLKAAAGLAAGADSDIVDLGEGQYAAVQVDKILPPAVPPLDELRPLLTRYWLARDVETRLQAKATGLAEQVRKGAAMEAVATSAGVTVGHGVGVVRGAAGQTFSQQLLNQLFFAKPGEVVVGPDVKPGPIVVAKLQAAVPASGPADAQTAANQGANMTRSLLQDMGQAARLAARDSIKPRIDYRRAHAAVGGDLGAAP